MSYGVPQFNIAFGQWRMAVGMDWNDRSPLGVYNGQLRGPYKLRGDSSNAEPVGTAYGQGMHLLVAKGFDIYDGWALAAYTPDIVEIPSGTGRYYMVTYVDDVARGFDNEYRYAAIIRAYDVVVPNIPYWPIPYP